MRSGTEASPCTLSGHRPLALVALLYAAAFVWMPDGGFWINDNGLKFIQVDGIVRSGFSRLSIDWPGMEADPTLAFGPLTQGFMHVANGELHAAYSPAFAALTAPFYATFGTVGLYLLPLAGGILALVAVRRLAAEVSPVAQSERVQAFSVIAAGLATPLFFYSLVFWEHAPAIALSCFSILACVRYRAAPTLRRAGVVAVFAGLSCWLRTDAYLLGGLVLLAAWLGSRNRLRDGLVLAGAFVVTMAPVWLFHQIAFGHALGPHLQSQMWGDIDFATYVASRARTLVNVLARAHGSGAWTAVAVAPFALALLLRPVLAGERLRLVTPLFAAAGVVAGLVVLTGHLTAARPMNWLMVSNGLFASSPLCVLALLRAADGGASSAPPERARRLLLAISLGYAVLFAVFVPEVNSRGIHWGNRFLLPLYPVLAVLAGSVWVAWWAGFGERRWAAKAALGALLGVSLVLQGYSVVMLHDRKAFTRALNEKVAASALHNVVVDTWFLPVDLGPTFYEKSIFFVPLAERGGFRALARRVGIERALSIERDSDRPHGAETEILDDGWLNFSPVRLREVRLAPPAVPSDPSR